jgi:hypothetical protein
MYLIKLQLLRAKHFKVYRITQKMYHLDTLHLTAKLRKV